jgi:hypothetical protein
LRIEAGQRSCKTLWREAQALVGDGGLVVDVADPLEVIDQVMRYFYGLGVHGAKSKAPVEEVQRCFNRALHAASIAAPYRHARLSAVKHIDTLFPAQVSSVSCSWRGFHQSRRTDWHGYVSTKAGTD